VVEAARDLARELDVRHLVLAHRHLVGAVDHDVGGLHQGVAQEAVGEDVAAALGVLLDQVLVGRNALEPRERREEREQHRELGMLRHARLDEERGLGGVDAGGEPVDEHLPHRLLDHLGILVVRGERVPVGGEEIAGEFVLQAHPVLERAVIVAEVHRPRRSHSGKHAVLEHGL
jgi:hypothetical protein